MIVSRFESPPENPDVVDRGSEPAQATESLQASFRERPEDYLWVEIPKEMPPIEQGVDPEAEREAAEATRLRKQHDQIRHDELLAELRAAAEPPVPPVDAGGDRPDDGEVRPGDAGVETVRTWSRAEAYRRCEACGGSGKKWLLLVCPLCRGLGSVRTD